MQVLAGSPWYAEGWRPGEALEVHEEEARMF